MHIGLYFGSFNPIHNGHIAIAEYMYQQFRFDKIWFIVSPSNPLKKENDLLSEYKRLELVEVAIKNKNYFAVSDIEFQMEKPSYTYLTLRKIYAEYSQHTFALLLGGDSIDDIKLWKNYEKILQNYTIYIYPRTKKDNNMVKKNIIFTNPPLLNISSTQIRAKIKNREDISHFVCPEALQIIEKERLYLL
jgi:nicotinate-nucleotide adenylyltransferase